MNLLDGKIIDWTNDWKIITFSWLCISFVLTLVFIGLHIWWKRRYIPKTGRTLGEVDNNWSFIEFFKQNFFAAMAAFFGVVFIVCILAVFNVYH